MINISMVTDKDKEKIKQGYMDMYSNLSKFIFLYKKGYDFKNIDLKDITRIAKNGSYTIYSYNGIYFEVQACLSNSYYTNPGYYMTFDNIMGNYFSCHNMRYSIKNLKYNDKMFRGYQSPKIAVKNYILGLVEIIFNNEVQKHG